MNQCVLNRHFSNILNFYGLRPSVSRNELIIMWHGPVKSIKRRKQYISIDLDIFKAYNIAMKIANIAEFKNHLSSYLAAVEAGEEVEVRKRNVPVARVVPVINNRKNRTMLGCGRGSAETIGDLTEPQIPESDWEILRDSSG